MGFFFTVFYQPLSNLLFGIHNLLATELFWISVVLFVLLIKLALLPLSIKAQKTQKKLQNISKDILHIKNTITDKQKQAEKMLALYKEKGVNPFSPLLSLFVQLPIILSIFFIVKDIGENEFGFDGLYSFIEAPVDISYTFVGIDLTAQGGLLIAVSLLVSQFVFIKISQKNNTIEGNPAVASFQKTILYSLPLIISVTSLFFVGLIGFYWLVFNVLGVIQELFFVHQKYD